MAGRAFVSRFSPNRTDPEVLEAIFVQRHRLAEIWLERLRESVLSGTRHHLLAVGPRGSGKSHLVVLLLHRLRQDPAVMERVRIAWLPEDETTPSFWKFLLRILRALHAEYGDTFPPPPREHLNRAVDAHRAAVLTRYLLEKLDGRVLLVVVENLDDVMRGLGVEGQRRWRSFLQENRVAVTLATAQQITKDLSSRDKPFFNFFQIEHLQPLTADEALSLLQKLAGQSGNTRLAEFLQTPAGRARVRAIRHLTGGSHRVFIILSEFATRENLDNLVSAFEELLDELTPYYQERLRWLPDQQREIVEFLCRQSRTVQVKEIAVELFLSEQVTAAQLKGLRDKRYVTAASVGRESRYELAEPLMRLCVEIKDPRREPIRLIVEFLRVWYDRADVESRLECLPAHADLERRYFRAVLHTHEPSKPDLLEEALERDLDAARNSGDLEVLVRILVDLAATSTSSQRCSSFGNELYRLRSYKDASVAYKRALAFEPDDVITWIRLGHALIRIEQFKDALIAYQRALEIEPGNAVAWKYKGAILWRLGRDTEGITAIARGLEISPNDADAWNGMGYSLSWLERYEESLSAYQRALELAPKDVIAWSAIPYPLSRLGRYEEALFACDQALRLRPENATIYAQRGRAQLGLGQINAAIKDFKKGVYFDKCNTGAYEGLATAYLIQGDWQAVESALTNSFRQSWTGIDITSWYLPEFLATMFHIVTDPSTWKSRVNRIAELSLEARQDWKGQRIETGAEAEINPVDGSKYVRPLTLLGEALVRSLKEKTYTQASMEALGRWVEAWGTAAALYPSLALSLRLFEVGLRYVRTNDERVLLDLVQEERAILRDFFRLDTGAVE